MKGKFKAFLVGLTALTMCLFTGAFFGCQTPVDERDDTDIVDEKDKANSVSLSQTTLTLTEGGETVTLTATVKDQDGKTMTGQSLEWATSNAQVVTVENGVVTIVGAGQATITVTVKGTQIKATCAVTVKAAQEPQTATSIELNETSLNLVSGGETMTGQTLEWISGDTEVVTVSDGVVTIVGIGQTTITVKVSGTNVQATCSVTVTSSTVSVTGVRLNTNSVNLTVGNTATLTATISPENATNKSVTWSTSNDEVVTVVDGVVTAVGAGTATITVSRMCGNCKGGNG